MLEMRARPCPVCRSDGASRLFARANLDPAKIDRFSFASRKLPEYMHCRLVECRTCDLLYSDPAPTAAALAASYREAAFDSGEESRHAARTYGRFLDAIGSWLKCRQGAVDIGTGDGAFLSELLRCGFTGSGWDRRPRAMVEGAGAEVRGLIRQEMFRSGTFAAGSLSLITCFQTIEHLDDPLAMCRHAWQRGEHLGVLFLIGHNRRALSAWLLGRKSPIFDIEHLQLFSPASLRYMLREAGFVDVEIRRVVNCYPLSYWARLLPLPARLKRGLTRLLSSSFLGRLPVPLAAGNLAAIARKGGA